MARLPRGIAVARGAERNMLASIKDQGLKLTRPRLAVVAALANEPHTKTFEQIVALTTGEATPRSVYSVLKMLSDLDLVHEYFHEGKRTYEIARMSEHLHVVDKNGNVHHGIPFPEGMLAALRKHLARYGYELNDVKVEAHADKVGEAPRPKAIRFT